MNDTDKRLQNARDRVAAIAYGEQQGDVEVSTVAGDEWSFMEPRGDWSICIFDRNQLGHFLNDIDADLWPVIGAYPFSDSRGRMAYVAFGVTGYSFSGIDIISYGAFQTREKVEEYFSSTNHIATEDPYYLSSAEKMSGWRHR